MSAPLAATPAPEVPDAIARAERRRGIEGPYHPEARHDPGRAFAAASRAVRLTLMLEARIDEQILALRNGVTPKLAGWGVDATPETAGVRHEVARGSRDLEACEIGDGDRPLRRDWESLVEREDDEDLLAGGFDDCVAAIKAELEVAASVPSPLAGEGGRRGPGACPGLDPGDEESTGPTHSIPSGVTTVSEAGATPHPTRCAGHLLPQGEKGTRRLE